ncbi:MULTISPECIES: hypothetical protein [Pseudomonas]|uniref:Uncharacterized protein n=1 Tax=Pseudomonas lutea TaxID=243924 RepID=A0A9X8QLQ3_9PSED|nr:MULTISPECIES: hypothetical protein [Pseudomonas]SER36270.1 hypothetical protein SAMN05216409_11844 [Pseudomonas lutea]
MQEKQTCFVCGHVTTPQNPQSHTCAYVLRNTVRLMSEEMAALRVTLSAEQARVAEADARARAMYKRGHRAGLRLAMRLVKRLTAGAFVRRRAVESVLTVIEHADLDR